MSVNLKAARDFVYTNGVLWERALFAHRFQGADVEPLHRCWRAYKNTDGGWGNALEHDVRCPASHPLALEFLLSVMAQHGVPAGDLFDGTAAWLEAQRQPDGSLRNPPDVLDYPHGPWWDESGGQTHPDSIVGNLERLDLCTDSLRRTTAAWVDQNLTVDKICANDWLFMAYHAYDYFSTSSPLSDHAARRQAAIDKVVRCAEQSGPERYYEIFYFAPTPDSPVAQALPPALLRRMLDHVESAQDADGGWRDEHGLAQWRPYVTIMVLAGLRAHGRDIGHRS